MSVSVIATDFVVQPRSMINREGLQRIDISCVLNCVAHLKLHAFGEDIDEACDVALPSGKGTQSVLLPQPERNMRATFQLLEGVRVIAETIIQWDVPRKWTIYTMVSSHTDIGLHNPQYIQRHNGLRFIDEAAELCNATEDRDEADRYRYTIEGSWVWNNYPADRGEDAARRIIEKYIKTGKIGLCGGIAGNHTQVFGFEEINRSVYERRELLKKWGVKAQTMSMIDNNGMSWAIVQPYAEAGFKNILFSPNQWNPLPSTVWQCDRNVSGYIWNCAAGGGGARIDVRLESELPLVFRWRAADDESELLVYCTQAQYAHAESAFGFDPYITPTDDAMYLMEQRTAETLSKMNEKCPFDLCAVACYKDDQEPNLTLTDTFARWNSRWSWPKMRTLGDPDAFFDEIRERFYDQLPVLSGDITGGWYQHPLSASELLAQKLEADRRLSDAEKYASIASAITGANYPAEDFSRSWHGLLLNDEHSYGTSGYSGRRVFETWMQHRDWIELAEETATRETKRALSAIAEHIASDGEKLAVFNPSALWRNERVSWEGREAAVCNIPPFGYKTVSLSEFGTVSEPVSKDAPPVIENCFYRLRFAKNGAIASIYDKQLSRELLDPSSPYGANELIYTKDNHKSYAVPGEAKFTLQQADGRLIVTACMNEPMSGASIQQTVTLDELHRRIDIENCVEHVRGLVNNHRYFRYLYYAFPFAVKKARRICQLNGCEAEYAKDVTGHGTDVYMPAHEWCCAENDEYGVGLIQADTHLVEFDHIHPDKTDFANAGEGSAIFSYVANDWLQMHQTGGSHVNFRLRYSITSYTGDHKSLADMAEAFVFPVSAYALSEKIQGDLPKDEHSFMQTNRRLVALKRAEDGRGLIARLFGEKSLANVESELFSEVERVTTDEQSGTEFGGGIGFTTLRLGASQIRFPVREPNESNYIGLMSHPRAGCSENDGQLYLLWKQSPEAKYYELYRSEESGFEPSKNNLIERVDPGEYRVARFVDTGLENHKAYYYRVRAVPGTLSEEFCGITREKISD